MNARIQWLCAVVVLGCACSASAPKVVQEPRLRDGLTLELNGEMRELEFILVDALGRADSLDVAGKPVAEIRGCTRGRSILRQALMRMPIGTVATQYSNSTDLQIGR